MWAEDVFVATRQLQLIWVTFHSYSRVEAASKARHISHDKPGWVVLHNAKYDWFAQMTQITKLARLPTVKCVY